MPTFRHARSTKILIGEFDLSGYFREGSIAQTADTAEATAFGMSSKEYVMGMTDARYSLGGLFAGDSDGIDETLNSIFGQESATVFTYAPEGLTVGRRVFPAKVHEASYQVQGSVSDVVAVSAELQATGSGKSGVSLANPATTISSTGATNGANVDNGASTNKGGYGNIHLLSLTGFSNVAAKIQHSSDNSTWADLVSFTALTAIGAEFVSVASGTTINRHLRAVITTTGSGTLTAHVNFARLAA